MAEAFQSNWKPSRTARKKAEHTAKLARRSKESSEKAVCRRRDRGCRFPGCGCKKLGLRLEVSHDQHKGMGGNPEGDRSVREWMVQLCVHRHQDGAISRHKGTMRAVYLTANGYEGPVAWEVDRFLLDERFGLAVDALGNYVFDHEGRAWFRVAEEDAQRKPITSTPVQRRVLKLLAEMDV